MRQFIKYTLASLLAYVILMIIGTVFMFGMIGTLAALGDQPVKVKSKSILTIKLNAPIVERAQEDPFSNIDFGYSAFNRQQEIGLDNILMAIKEAKEDNNIRGIYLNLSSISAGYATIEEIREALIDFKKSEKFIYAYSEQLSQNAYYLASVADNLVLNPQGMLQLSGLSGNVTFYKEALERLGVKMQIIRHGKFKSAVEPFLTDHMSPENKLQMQTYLGSLWKVMETSMASSRNLSVKEFNTIVDKTTMFEPAEDLVEMGLVDSLLYKDQVLDQLKELSGTRDGKDLNTIGLSKYVKSLTQTDNPYAQPEGDQIAVIYAQGGIDDGSSEGIKSGKISATIREAREDSTIKAIVLRINSPGGSAYGSEVIWREVKLATEEKPVVVSMGDYAASGGYYIACPANEIFAENTTITGSIGIFAQIPQAEVLLKDKLGLTFDGVGTNENSMGLASGSLSSLARPLSDFERAKLQRYIENGYDTFIGHVADGRSMTKAEVDSIGQGRVWAAEDALSIGLVDSIGTLDNAIRRAASLASVDDYEICKLPKAKDPIEELLKELNLEAKSYLIKQELGDEYELYQQVKGSIRNSGVMAKMPFEIEIR